MTQLCSPLKFLGLILIRMCRVEQSCLVVSVLDRRLPGPLFRPGGRLGAEAVIHVRLLVARYAGVGYLFL